MMGKGTITAGGTAGLYSVTLELARERITAKIAKMTADIAVLTAKIAQIQAQIDAVQAQMDTLAAQIAIYEADRVKYQKEYCAAVGSMVTLISTKETYDRQKSMAVLQKKALTARIAYLGRAVPADPSVAAWCADKTENLTGTVGTIEIPGERGSVLIQPGYNGNAAYSKARDGHLQPSIAGDPSAVFYNWAMLPGWQKWKPTYRIGAITAIDKTAHTCSVTLDAAASSAQSLNINQGVNLTAVPIVYMTCNSGAFSIGDRVVVQFVGQDFAHPKVIGFESNPKPCSMFTLTLSRGDGSDVTPALNCWIDVYDSAKNYINTTEEYDASSKKWLVNAPIGHTEDTNGYYVFYGCDTAIDTQYPYRYKSADQYKSADLIHPGDYSDTIPYWLVGADSYSIAPISNTIKIPLAETLTKSKTVYSSVPYIVTYIVYAYPNLLRSGYYDKLANWASHDPLCINYSQAIFSIGNPYPDGDQVQVSCAGEGLNVAIGPSGTGSPTTYDENAVNYLANVSGATHSMTCKGEPNSGFPVTCSIPSCPVYGTYDHTHLGCYIGQSLIGMQCTYE